MHPAPTVHASLGYLHAPRAQSSMRNALRSALRWFNAHVPIRGRHRLAATLGRWLAEPITIRYINGIKVELDRDIAYHCMMLYGMYEENIFNYLKNRLKPGMVVLEPGCNIGYFAAEVLGLVTPGGQVHSFEPSLTCQERIKRNNNVARIPGWHFHEMALTDHVGTHTFHDTPRVIKFGYAGLQGVCAPNDRISYQVKVTTVDAFCQQHGIGHVDFLKLDIEGSELPALQGAQRMLKSGAIDTILVETEYRPENRELNDAIAELLTNAGFTPYHVERSGRLIPMDLSDPPPHKEDIIWERTRN